MKDTDHEKTVNEVLAEAFKKHGIGFMTLKTFLKLTTTPDLKRIGITKGAPQDKIKAALNPLPEYYRHAKYRNSTYLIPNIPVGKLLADYIREKKRKTFKQVCQILPFKKDELTLRVNELLDAGVLKVQISSTGKIVLYPPEKETWTGIAPTSAPEAPEPAPDLSEADEKTRIKAFKQAYDMVGKGSNYVFIYRIRRQLQWPRKAFDVLFDALMVDGWLAAHPGNPGELAAEDVRDSYQDDFGDLYITASWRKPV